MQALSSKELERFSRFFIVSGIGIKGLSKLRQARVAVVGCGATGSHIAEQLTRMGVKHLKLIDPDLVEIANLYRVSAYVESDARKLLPKAVALSRYLKKIDGEIRVEYVVDRLTPLNVDEYLEGVDLIIDGTDNLDARFLINEFSVRHGIPWIYVGFQSWYGNVMLVDSKEGGPCLECLIKRGSTHQAENLCDIVGVTPTVVSFIASVASNIALMKLMGIGEEDLKGKLFIADMKRFELTALKTSKRSDCRVCQLKNFTYLEERVKLRNNVVSVVCSARSAEILPVNKTNVKLKLLASKLSDKGFTVAFNKYVVKAVLNDGLITALVFGNGRVVLRGVTSAEKALTIYNEVLAPLIMESTR